MYKIAASDLDGTLLTSEHKIAPFTKKVLTQLHHQGIEFVFATGRHHVDVANIREQLGIPAYMITSNGARVHNCKNEMIFKQNLTPDVVKELINMIKEDDEILIHIYRDDDWLLNKDEKKECYQVNIAYQLFDVENPPLENVAKVFITREDKDHEKLVIWEEKFKAAFADRASVVFSTPFCLEVMDRDVSKGHALEAVAKMKGYQLADCIAFGDGMNDFEMLYMAGKGLVMETSHYKVKLALPNHEVIGHCDDQAVAHYLLEHIIKE